jgi:hypothetical protein
VREAMSLGTPLITAADSETVTQCYGPNCPIIYADDAQSCRQAMVNVAKMNETEFTQLGQSVTRWADENLHYDHCVGKLLDVLGGVHG